MSRIELYTHPDAMTPLFPETMEGELRELAAELIKKSTALGCIFNHDTRHAIAVLVESMNSYYTNLIEGHNTHPLDIERALNKNYSREPKKKLLQLESRAHVLANSAMKEKMKMPVDVYSADFICWLHSEFYRHMPEEFQNIKTRSGKTFRMVPGMLRETEVEVGRHVAPAASALGEFLRLFADNYNSKNNGDPLKRIIAIAASHHRLAWIHPFADGNGRVVRLFSEAGFISENIAGDGLWSVSRGLSRHNKLYYEMLANGDMPRLGDYDGRGNLSDRHLYAFCRFFLETCIDQTAFMANLLEPEGLLKRVGAFVELMESRDELRIESRYVIEEAVLKGKLSRGDMQRITGKSENVAREIMNRLLEMNLLVSESDALRSPVRINFPIRYAPYFLPKLFPGDIEATMI